MDLNKAMIIGRLTQDPEVRTTPTGQTVASFSVATNLVWTDQSGQKQEKVEFHNVVAWRRLAEICGQYLRKGAKIYLEGRIQTRDWVGQDNVKRYRTEIIADNMIMLDRAGAVNSSPASRNMAPMPDEQPSANSEPVINIDEPAGDDDVVEEDIKVENIPF
ncbi:MAG: single-stranded DNA-binding protein [Candidatus Omnitrophica bacterium]|nr:single-stranded DNA-binding protein [Candidatus Omnitrophota bacterium]